MKKLFFYLMMAAATCTVASCGDDDDSSSNGGANTDPTNTNKNEVTLGVPTEVTRLEFPKLKGGTSTAIVYHSTSKTYNPDGVNFSVEWDRTLKSQRWSCYTLTSKNKTKVVDRWKGQAYADQTTTTTAAYFFDLVNLSLSDYYYTTWDGATIDCLYRSGFDHGHICNSQDRLYSTEANKQTFYMTNMQPQYAVFNGSSKEHQYKGLWLTMENFVHNYSLEATDTMYVCKGGTIDNESQILQRVNGGVIVPKYYYAALLLKNGSNYKAIGFWFEHTNVYHGDDALKGYIVNIDELEQKTGIDFFCNLPDAIERKVQSSTVAEMKKAWGL